MRNFGKLGFKSFLDSYDDPSVWNSPRLIVQLDNLMSIFERSDDVISGECFHLRYDMIILDEPESLMAHFDQQTMARKEISIWNFFDELLKHSGNMLLMGGDISNRSLSFASAYGELTLHQQQQHGRRQDDQPDPQRRTVAGAARRGPEAILRRGPALQDLRREPELH